MRPTIHVPRRRPKPTGSRAAAAAVAHRSLAHMVRLRGRVKSGPEIDASASATHPVASVVRARRLDRRHWNG